MKKAHSNHTNRSNATEESFRLSWPLKEEKLHSNPTNCFSNVILTFLLLMQYKEQYVHETFITFIITLQVCCKLSKLIIQKVGLGSIMAGRLDQ